jgi:hypothetical protein
MDLRFDPARNDQPELDERAAAAAALSGAVIHADLARIGALLSSADPAWVDKHGFNALAEAAAGDQTDAILALLPFFDPNDRLFGQDGDRLALCGDTPLMIAISRHATGAVSALIERSDLSIQNARGQDALDIALAERLDECAALLIDKGVRAGAASWEGLRVAADRDCSGATLAFLRRFARDGGEPDVVALWDAMASVCVTSPQKPTTLATRLVDALAAALASAGESLTDGRLAAFAGLALDRKKEAEFAAILRHDPQIAAPPQAADASPALRVAVERGLPLAVEALLDHGAAPTHPDPSLSPWECARGLLVSAEQVRCLDLIGSRLPPQDPQVLLAMAFAHKCGVALPLMEAVALRDSVERAQAEKHGPLARTAGDAALGGAETEDRLPRRL